MAQSKVIVIKLGGSYLFSGGINVDELRQISAVVKKLMHDGYRLVMVCGGGAAARTYISAADALNCNNGVKDNLGILISRVNAQLLIEAIGPEYAYGTPPESLVEIRQALQTYPCCVTAGLQPGQSTTAVAALCAEFLNANKVIFGTNVEGIYDYTGTNILDKIHYKELEQLFCTEDNSLPGSYCIMDRVALTILSRSHISAAVILCNAENIENTVRGMKVGTDIIP